MTFRMCHGQNMVHIYIYVYVYIYIYYIHNYTYTYTTHSIQYMLNICGMVIHPIAEILTKSHPPDIELGCSRWGFKLAS